MNLNIVDPSAAMLHTSFGISEKRSNEISDALDVLMKSIYGKGEVKLCDIMQGIAALCLNVEELVFAVFLNARWMERKSNLTLK